MSKILQNLDIVYTNKEEISCDGDDHFSKHPKIYLKLSINNHIEALKHIEEKKVTCPYCGKIFIYKEEF